jgi:hypothetical protein
MNMLTIHYQAGLLLFSKKGDGHIVWTLRMIPIRGILLDTQTMIAILNQDMSGVRFANKMILPTNVI